MSKILIVAEHDGSKLNASTLKSVTCAAKIAGATIDVAVLASDASAVAAQAAAIAGVAKVLVLENPANAEPLAAVYAPQLAKAAAGYTHLFGPSTTFGKDVMPRVARARTPELTVPSATTTSAPLASSFARDEACAAPSVVVTMMTGPASRVESSRAWGGVRRCRSKTTRVNGRSR